MKLLIERLRAALVRSSAIDGCHHQQRRARHLRKRCLAGSRRPDGRCAAAEHGRGRGGRPRRTRTGTTHRAARRRHRTVGGRGGRRGWCGPDHHAPQPYPAPRLGQPNRGRRARGGQRRADEHGSAARTVLCSRPSSQPACTIGGNVAENAGGAHCLAHGVTTNHVLALEAVLIPSGQVVRVGGPAHDRPGYDLMGLLVGSEGTLAVVTEITVRLLVRAEGVATVLAAFDGVAPASETVSAIIGQGIVPVALELMDGMTTRAVAAGLPENAGAVLLIECEGLREELDDKEGPLATVQAICRAHGARDLRIAFTAADRNALWKARKSARGALGTLAPNCYVHDGVVPRSKVPALMARIEAVAAEFEVPIATYLHAGDGNVHPNVLFDARRPAEAQRAAAAGEAILRACLELGGVLSGEHGIGTEKQAYMAWALTTTDLRAQAHVKLAFDPDERLNPHKLFPTPGFCGEVRGASRPPAA